MRILFWLPFYLGLKCCNIIAQGMPFIVTLRFIVLHCFGGSLNLEWMCSDTILTSSFLDSNWFIQCSKSIAIIFIDVTISLPFPFSHTFCLISMFLKNFIMDRSFACISSVVSISPFFALLSVYSRSVLLPLSPLLAVPSGWLPCMRSVSCSAPPFFLLFTLLTSPFPRCLLRSTLMRKGCCVSAVVLTRRFGLGIPFCTFGLEKIRYRGKLYNIHLLFGLILVVQ
jgi:hypothetical protein